MPGSDPAILPLTSTAHSQMIDISAAVAGAIPAAFEGVCHVFCQHTTAAVTISENADPDVVHDVLAALDRIVPWRHPDYRHSEGNSAAHVKSILVGPAVAVPVRAGRLVLGQWQALFFCEFDGPRSRRVVVQLVAAGARAAGDEGLAPGRQRPAGKGGSL